MPKPKVIILRTAGTNCDYETAFAFEKAGASAQLIHINCLIRREVCLLDYQIMAIPGGFTYGDDIAAGRILANELKHCLRQEISKFIERGRLAIGICNGFQVLVKAGLIPGGGDLRQTVTLTCNDSAKFEDRWVYLRKPENSCRLPEKCIWLQNLPEIIELPVAHGEGKFVTKDESVLNELKKNNQVVFRYVNREGKADGYPANPNGSIDDIAGICDKKGLILGLMPHPERHIDCLQHPRWVRERRTGEGDGLRIFRNGVAYAKKHL